MLIVVVAVVALVLFMRSQQGESPMGGPGPIMSNTIGDPSAMQRCCFDNQIPVGINMATTMDALAISVPKGTPTNLSLSFSGKGMSRNPGVNVLTMDDGDLFPPIKQNTSSISGAIFTEFRKS